MWHSKINLSNRVSIDYLAANVRLQLIKARLSDHTWAWMLSGHFTSTKPFSAVTKECGVFLDRSLLIQGLLKLETSLAFAHQPKDSV